MTTMSVSQKRAAPRRQPATSVQKSDDHSNLSKRVAKAAKRKTATRTSAPKTSTCSCGSNGAGSLKDNKVYSKLSIKDRLGMVFKDRVLWIVVGFVALSVIAALASNPFTIAAAALGLGVLAVITYMNRKEVSFQMSANLSLFKNKFNLLKYTWHERADEHVVLGGIPLKNHGHIDKFKKEMNIGTVICLTDSFELTEDNLTQRPVRPEEWEKAEVTFKQFPTTDFVPVPIDVINDSADYMHKKVKEANKKKSGEKIYLHCKAGVGRTPTVYSGYLVKHKGYTAKEALEYVRKVRPSTNMSKSQIARVYEYEAYLNGYKAGKGT
ncbi:MAG: hypothetical protein S4CHLAM37_11620 [Chlamydiia bacterium]|nr:hypothetical protein [Chlamydiia bacterium]